MSQNSAPPAFPSISVTGGAFDGKALLLGGAVGQRTVGSARGSHLHLPLGNVEALHARISWDERAVSISDAGTFAGTFVNGEKLKEARELMDGDRISLGPPNSPNSAKLLVALPGHPRDFPELAARETAEAAPSEAAQQGRPADEPAPGAEAPPGDRPQVTKSGTFRRPTAEDYSSQPVMVGEAKPRTAPVPVARPQARRRGAERKPVSRVTLVAVALGLAALGSLFTYLRLERPAPVLHSLLPPKAEPGQTVQINGAQFETSPDGNAVSFGEQKATVTSATETRLAVVVPPSLPATDAKTQHRVRVEVHGKKSNALFFQVFLGPRVAGVEPDVAMPGDEIRIKGENFTAATSVSIGGVPAQVLEAQPGSLRLRVPELPAVVGKSVPLQVRAGANAAPISQLLIGRLPLLLGLEPRRASVGERVAMSGRGFDPSPGGTVVWFGARRAVVVGASESQLTAIVPGAGRLAGPGDAPVKVEVRGEPSQPVLFTVMRPSSSSFTPRFFPEPAPGSDPERVYVSTELGPVMLLAARGDAVNAAERAARIASALNGLMESAARGAVTLELREAPEPAVAVAGTASPLAVALPQDAAAYEGRPSPRAVARLWSAVLQDYLALFGQRQRPFRVLELTPRGKVLLDLFAEAERRSGGGGVSAGLLESLAPDRMKALRELALLVPGDAPAGVAAAAAVAGRWSGSMETSQGARRIEVRLSTAPSGIEGTLSTGSGKVSVDLPLQSVRYEKGVVRFTAHLAGTPHHFSGKTEGRSLSGTIEGADGKSLGRFALTWQE